MAGKLGTDGEVVGDAAFATCKRMHGDARDPFVNENRREICFSGFVLFMRETQRVPNFGIRRLNTGDAESENIHIFRDNICWKRNFQPRKLVHQSVETQEREPLEGSWETSISERGSLERRFAGCFRWESICGS